MSGAEAGAGNRSRLRADARRNRDLVVAAAKDVFIELGVDAPLEEVARRAGVGIATLYRRFPDRQALMRGVALQVLEDVVGEARAVLADEPDPFRALARYLHRALELRIAAVLPILDGRLDLDGEEDLRAAHQELTPLYELIVRRAHEHGLRSDVGPGDLGLIVIRLARPLPGGFHREFDDDLAHRQLDIFLDGLRPGVSGLAGSGMTISEVRAARM
jgi:AcrR family transcriptional regulator